MINHSIEQLLENMVHPEMRMKRNEEADGFGRLVESTVAWEKTQAELIKCQTLQTNLWLKWLLSKPSPFPIMLLISWTEATNRWLEAWVMFQWMWFVRLGKLLPYWIMDRHVKRDANHPSAIVEAHLQTVSASTSLAEAQIHLITQILYELKQTPTTALRLNKLERGLIQMVESIGESMRIMVRLHEHLVVFHHEKNSTVDGPVQVSGSSLLQSIKKLSVQTDGSLLVSNEFIPLLKESVKRLIGSLEGSKNSAPLIFHPEPPLPKPWLNEKIFGHFWKETK